MAYLPNEAAELHILETASPQKLNYLSHFLPLSHSVTHNLSLPLSLSLSLSFAHAAASLECPLLLFSSSLGRKRLPTKIGSRYGRSFLPSFLVEYQKWKRKLFFQKRVRATLWNTNILL